MVVQDVARRFVGSSQTPLNPAAVLDVIVPLLRSYGISLVYTDQYHLESFGQLARERGIELQGVTFTAKTKAQMYGISSSCFCSAASDCWTKPETIRELKSLERVLDAAGAGAYRRARGMHDDMATVVALAGWQVMPYARASKPPEPETPAEPSIHERCMARQPARIRSANCSGRQFLGLSMSIWSRLLGVDRILEDQRELMKEVLKVSQAQTEVAAGWSTASASGSRPSRSPAPNAAPADGRRPRSRPLRSMERRQEPMDPSSLDPLMGAPQGPEEALQPAP